METNPCHSRNLHSWKYSGFSINFLIISGPFSEYPASFFNSNVSIEILAFIKLETPDLKPKLKKMKNNHITPVEAIPLDPVVIIINSSRCSRSKIGHVERFGNCNLRVFSVDVVCQ